MDQSVKLLSGTLSESRQNKLMQRIPSDRKDCEQNSTRARQTHVRGKAFSKSCRCLLTRLVLVVFLGALFFAFHLKLSGVKGRKVTVRISRRRAAAKMHHSDPASDSNMLTVAMTGCDASAAWQSLGLYYTFLRYFEQRDKGDISASALSISCMSVGIDQLVRRSEISTIQDSVLMHADLDNRGGLSG